MLLATFSLMYTGWLPLLPPSIIPFWLIRRKKNERKEYEPRLNLDVIIKNKRTCN